MKNEECKMQSGADGGSRGRPPRLRHFSFFIFHFSLIIPCFLTGCAGNSWHLFKDSPSAQAKQDAETKKPQEQVAAADKDAKKEPEDGDSAWKFWDKWMKPDVPQGDAQTLILHGDKLENEKPLGKQAAELAGAHEFYRQGDYEKARELFHFVANNPKNPPALAEEARFYEAESLRRLGKYPKASDTYHKMLQDFPSGAYRELACQRMFDIANYWLKDTRADMDEVEKKKEGMHWPALTLVHWEKEKPFVDEEGRALETLDHVHLNDPTGPLADKALFLAGSVKFFREDYREADHYFTQLTELHPNSPLCEKAIELGIISKHMSTGGADYDGRKVAEARLLINKGLANYPKMNEAAKKEFLIRQLACCTMQQAEKDFKTAEFYRRTHHAGSAYFYYEIVRRRYPGTPFADQATQKMWDIRKEVEKKQEEKDKEAAAPKTAPPKEETAPPPRTVPPGGFPAQPDTAPIPRTLPSTSPRPAPPPLPVVPMEGLPPLPRSAPQTVPPAGYPAPQGPASPQAAPVPPPVVPMEGLPPLPRSVPQTLPPGIQ